MSAKAPAHDPIAARSPAMVRAFTWYCRRLLRRNFHGLRLDREGPPMAAAGAPVVVVANHPSWWDPIVFFVVARALFPDRIGFGPIEAAELERYAIFKRLGAFGVTPGTGRGAMVWLKTGRRILAKPDALLIVTAQGRFADARERPVRLMPGTSRLLRDGGGATVLPLAMEFVFWNERAPEILLRFGQPVPVAGDDLYGRLESALALAQDRLAERAQARDPSAFDALVSGRAGVGGVYDLGRRLRAAWSGASFDPSHEPGGRGR
ncbi:lysophospholipid acyltransferase family protein [Marinivivus vitaminiproducens]|uniref:lysophospholipid acyltransferase family protein n=1 Tax=Marinivivus vitaminiproducens TaxID=3035935 RepID=UPI0027A58D5B|nr:lysophospholipid acyltransferase family protein [Geminicoccaceae bacterium SCSIO 64248]